MVSGAIAAFMKTRKHRPAAAVLAFFIFVFIACDYGKKKPVPPPPEQPRFREAVIGLYAEELNERYKITVRGTLTQAKWDGIAHRIESTINLVYKNKYTSFREKAYFILAFRDNNAVIVVEETSEYSACKTTGDKILYLNVDAYNNTSMAVNIRDAIMAMAVSKTLMR
jgi:hypothetical protein